MSKFNQIPKGRTLCDSFVGFTHKSLDKEKKQLRYTVLKTKKSRLCHVSTSNSIFLHIFLVMHVILRHESEDDRIVADRASTCTEFQPFYSYKTSLWFLTPYLFPPRFFYLFSYGILLYDFITFFIWFWSVFYCSVCLACIVLRILVFWNLCFISLE